jgi:hypothetical protein
MGRSSDALDRLKRAGRASRTGVPGALFVGPLCGDDQSEGASQKGHHALGVPHLVFGDFGLLLVEGDQGAVAVLAPGDLLAPAWPSFAVHRSGSTAADSTVCSPRI